MSNKVTAANPQNAERPRGSGYIYQREGSANWWICYYFRGRAKRETSHSTDPAIALKKLDKRVKEIWAAKQGLQAFVPKAEKVYVDQLLDEEDKNYRLNGGRALPQFQSHVKPVRKAFGDLRAVDVTAKVVDDYVENRLSGNKRTGIRPRSAATINREIQLLGQAFKLGIQRRLIVSVPHIRRLPEHNVRQGFFEKPEFEAVVTCLPEYLRDFSRFAYITAWRKGQLSKLTWADVDRGAGVIVARAENVKNGRPHKIVIEGELAEIIDRRWAAREYEATNVATGLSQYVFHRDGLPVRDFRKAWKAACKAASLPGKLFHDFRRSGVRNMVRAGVREGVAMAISGHRTRAIFDRYNITSDEDLRQAVKQTSEHMAAQSAERKVVSIAHKK
jgi:integrase